MEANRERVGAAAARLQADLAEARQLADLSEFSPHAMVVHSEGVIRWANRETARLAGDRVLVHVARRLRSISASSAVGRLGGDEFLIVVCPSGATATRDLASRINQELRIERFGEVRLPSPLTATVGVASARPGVATVESLLRAADADLYTKRRAGRRRPPPGPT